MPKVSIVLPCYNVAPYVAHCLDSLINQTLSDIEIICVDDKSTDNTMEILSKYADSDSRIRVIALPENSGVSVARNTGIDASTGEYIGFVDPDDYVDHDYYEKLYNRIVAENADISIGNIAEHQTDGNTIIRDDLSRRILRDKKHFNYTVWCAIYRTEFLRANQIYCPVGITNGEDTVFCVKCAILANKIVGDTGTCYHYVRYENSAETKFYTERHVDSRIKMAHAIVDFLNVVPLSESDYKYHFNKAFWFLCYNIFEKTTVRSLRMKSLAHAIELYKKCKHKSYFSNRTVGAFLACSDTDGLYEYVNSLGNQIHTIKISLFKRIPLVKIARDNERSKIYVLGIPMFYIYYLKK